MANNFYVGKVHRELCCASIEAVSAAAKYRLERIELCQALEVGGLTPSYALIEEAVSMHSNVHVLIRHRRGDFVYSDEEKVLLLKEVRAVQSLGVKGVVIGSATNKLSVDQEFMKKAREVTSGELTFHRAFDDLLNPLQEIHALIDCGVDRVLTSGGKKSAQDALPELEWLCNEGKNKIQIMVGGGVNPENIKLFIDSLPISAIHFSATEQVDRKQSPLFSDTILQFKEERLQAILKAID